MHSEVIREIVARRGPGVPRAQGGYTVFPRSKEQVIYWREHFTRCDVAHARYIAKRSLDDGHTWENQRWLENDHWRTFGNLSVTFYKDRAYFNYYVGHGVDDVGNWDGCRAIVPIAWLYEPPAPNEPFREPSAKETKTFYDHLEQAQKTEISLCRQRSNTAIFSIRNALDIRLHGEIEWGDVYWEYMPPEPKVFTFKLAPKGTVKVVTNLEPRLIRPLYALRLYELQDRELLFRMGLLYL